MKAYDERQKMQNQNSQQQLLELEIVSLMPIRKSQQKKGQTQTKRKKKNQLKRVLIFINITQYAQDNNHLTACLAISRQMLAKKEYSINRCDISGEQTWFSLPRQLITLCHGVSQDAPHLPQPHGDQELQAAASQGADLLIQTLQS